MRKIYWCISSIIVLNFLFLPGCQTGQTNAPKVLAEFEYSNNTKEALLPVEFQGQIYQFDLDTGASNTIFDIRFKDKLGKPFLWPIPYTLSVVLANGKIAKGEAFPTPKAKIGPFKLKGSPFVGVMDSNITGGESPGTIGMDFLKKYVVQIDYDNKKVTFFKGKKEFDLFSMFKSRENKHPEWGEPVQLKTKLFAENDYKVKGIIFEDIETDFLIDSGWGLPYDAIDSNVLKRIESRMTREINDGNVPPYLILPVTNDYKIVERFNLDNLEFKDYLVKDNPYSVLGQEFLSRHIVTFDFPNKIMYLKKGKNFDKQPDIIIPIGVTGFVVNSKDYVVEKVDPNSSAYQKGIREKDILVKVNNETIQNMNITEFMKCLIKLPDTNGGIIPFTFKRGDDTFTAVFIKKSRSEIPREK